MVTSRLMSPNIFQRRSFIETSLTTEPLTTLSGTMSRF